MAKPTPKFKPRITIKTTLIKAVELVASNRVLITQNERRRWIFEMDKGAAKILMNIAAADANEGWAVVHALDRMSLYGVGIREAFNYYCQADIATFVRCVKEQDSRLTTWVNKNP